jgi:hypothetical protein
MKKTGLRLIQYWRSLPLQLYIITVLPLTVLLLFIAFGGVALHQNDMRALVGDRDERAIRSAAATLESELHHRKSTVTNLAILAGSADELAFEKILQTDDFAADFDGGYAFIDSNGILIDFTNSPTGAAQLEFWKWIAGNAQELSLATGSNLVTPSAAISAAVISKPFLDPDSNRIFVVISAYSTVRKVTAAGAFLPEMAAQALAESFPADQHITIYLLDSSRQPLYVSDMAAAANLPPEHPGIAEALRGESGTSYIQVGESEHVIAYSPIPSTGWALITEEDWDSDQPVPAIHRSRSYSCSFHPGLVALWFGAQIVRPAAPQ